MRGGVQSVRGYFILIHVQKLLIYTHVVKISTMDRQMTKVNAEWMWIHWQAGPVVSLVKRQLSTRELQLIDRVLKPLWASSGSLGPVAWRTVGCLYVPTVNSPQNCNDTKHRHHYYSQHNNTKNHHDAVDHRIESHGLQCTRSVKSVGLQNRSQG